MEVFKKRIISLALSGALLTSLTSCSSEKLLTNKEDNSNTYNYAAVIINDDNALVFLNDYYMYDNQYGEKYIDYKSDKFYVENICKINYVDKEDLEVKVKKLVGKDGNISYYDEENK